ncbi:putative ribonuclease H-like domain-containing protein [Tanacetum coccineum]|uniref:Ribonuclease H-like domain-containing protein n=1 Tax=Tanacetum coccineum TaxID=301880 RepID=A0ABQ4X753_9ASTR
MVPRAILMKTGIRSLNTARPINTAYPKTTVYSARPISHFSKSAQSTVKRPYQIRTTLTNKKFSQKVNTAKGKFYTARPNSAVVNAIRENQGHPQKEYKGYVDSRCSRHMTGNMSYLSDFKEFDRGYVTFRGGAKGEKIAGKGTLKTDKLDFEDVCFVRSPDFKLADKSQVLLKVPKKNNMCSVDMKNIVHKECLTCLVAKATLDESIIFTWVFFLATKDETSVILKSFITEKENLVDKKVKIIRYDNGTEFKNRVMSEFCEEKCIKKEFSAARTPQQNGVAKRRNRTLIKAARTMVLVVKPHNKTPYELLRGRTPALSFMRPFGCHVTIINTLDYLGKFDGKLDEGFFVGYLMNSKPFRVYNIRTRKVEESLHIRFLEDKPIIAGDGPKWWFDIYVLTKSLNYVPVVAGTNSNDLVDSSLFDSSSKNASNDEPLPSSDAGKKDDEGVNKESGFDDQERPENSTQDVKTVGPSINTASTNVNTGSLNINTVSPTVTTTPLEATNADFFGDETEVDMSNITTTYLVPSTPNTRIHKDHSLDHVIGDVQSGVQTRRMTKTTNEQGFISAVFEGKTHEDLHTCLFACFLSQEEPKKVIQALKDPRWIEAMQEELLQFKLQLVDPWCRLISWKCKKQTIVANSTTEVEYVATAICCEQDTAKAKIVNGEVQIQALVDGKKVIITKTSVRRSLQLKDAEVLRLLLGTNLVALWPQLSCILVKNLEGGVKFLMYPRKEEKVFLGDLPPLFQTMIGQAPKELGEGSEIPTDPQHTPTIIQTSTSQPQKKQLRRKQRKDIEVPQPSGSTKPITNEAANAEHVPTHSNDPHFSGEDRLQLKELLELCTKLSERVLDLDNTKTSQAAEITKLKERIKKMERRNKSRTPGLKRLRKVGRSTQVVSSKDEGVLNEQEVEDEKVVSTAEVTTISATTTTINELTLAQTLIKIKEAKPKVVTTAATTTTTAGTRPKARGVVKLAKQKEEDANIAEWDNVQAMIDADYELATILQAQEQEDLIIEERSKMFVELMDKRKKYGYRVGKRELQEGRDGTRKQFKRAGEELESDNSKRKKLDEKEEEKLTKQREEDANIAEWDNVQAMIDADYELAVRLQAQEQEELTLKNKIFDEVQKAFDKTMGWIDSFVSMDFEVVKGGKEKDEGSVTRAEERSSKRAGIELEQERIKKQKIDDDQE